MLNNFGPKRLLEVVVVAAVHRQVVAVLGVELREAVRHGAGAGAVAALRRKCPASSAAARNRTVRTAVLWWTTVTMIIRLCDLARCTTIYIRAENHFGVCMQRDQLLLGAMLARALLLCATSSSVFVLVVTAEAVASASWS